MKFIVGVFPSEPILLKCFQLVGLIVGMGIEMGKAKVDSRGRITLPDEIRREMGLTPGKEIRVENIGKGVLIRPAITKKDFIKSLEGCITSKNRAEALSPLEIKKMWGPMLASD